MLKSGVRPRISVGCLKYSLTSFLIEKARGFGTMLKYISNVLCVIYIHNFVSFYSRAIDGIIFVRKNKDGGFLELCHKLRHSVTLKKIICTMTEYDCYI